MLYESLNIPIPDAQAINRALTNSHHGAGDGEAANKKRKLNNAHEEVVVTEGTKVLALPSGPVTCNSILTKHIDTVKPFIRELVEHANLLKMWVTFLIPKIEDGNNFGVSIQEDTLGEIRAVEGEAATFYDAIARYHINRGKIISKVAKYPHIEDYRRVVAELDEKEFLSLRIVMSEIRNHYAAMYDLIAKNWEKIIRPRTSNAENLY
jgi:proteasome activator subunit 3 (PA28 gamma)